MILSYRHSVTTSIIMKKINIFKQSHLLAVKVNTPKLATPDSSVLTNDVAGWICCNQDRTTMTKIYFSEYIREIIIFKSTLLIGESLFKVKIHDTKGDFKKPREITLLKREVIFLKCHQKTYLIFI